jgi:serine/threonine protein kinase
MTSEREIRILKKLKHKNIVRLIEVCQTKRKYNSTIICRVSK